MFLGGILKWRDSRRLPSRLLLRRAKFDIFAAFIEREGEMTLRVEYSTELFAAASIERMLGHFQTLLEGIVAKPERRIDNYRCLPKPRSISFWWSGTIPSGTILRTSAFMNYLKSR